MTEEEKIIEAKEKLLAQWHKTKDGLFRTVWGISSIGFSYLIMIVILNLSFEQAVFAELCYFVGRWEYIAIYKSYKLEKELNNELTRSKI